MMINNWRTTSDVVFMVETINGSNNIYIASPEKKQYEVAVSKLCKNCYSTNTINNEEFDIKINIDRLDDSEIPDLYLRTSQLPELGWVKVANFYTPSIWNILSQCKTDCGEFLGKFKVVFTESYPTLVSFVSPDMLEYKESEEELIRRIKCEIGKKTKTMKPGHRYDILKETRYYLCDVVSRKNSNCASDFQNDIDTNKTKAYIYTNRILDSDKNISDVLKNRKFGSGLYDLKISLSTSSSWIDSGLKLNNDFTGDIKDYWEYIVNNTSKAGIKTVTESNYQIYTNVADIFGIFSCQSKDNLSYKISDSLFNKVKDIITNLIEFNLLVNWKVGVSNKDLKLGDTIDSDKNAKALEKLFYNSIEDENINKVSYYKSLFSILGLDIEKMCELTVIGFNPCDLTSSFNNYLKYKFYWRNKKYIYSTTSSKPILDFDLNTVKNTDLTIESLFGKTELSQVIRDLFNYAKNNYGSGVKQYNVVKSKERGFSVIFCIITLDDIIKFKKGASNISEILKNDIISNKFDSIWINCKESDIL